MPRLTVGKTIRAKDCGKQECPLFLWRPWQPGGQPKRGRRNQCVGDAKTGV